MKGPDFVCIGAQKGGTTWLYDNLVHHPAVWMPPVKEIHFFNLIAPHRELLGLETDKHPRGLRKYAPLLQEPTLTRARWLYLFFHEQKSIGWYRRLFKGVPDGCMAGDITPAYSTLDERGVEFARQVLRPDCKVFVILRNPMERIWSGVKMSYRSRRQDITQAAIEQLRMELDHPSHRIRSDYSAMLSLWRGAFGDNFQVFLYDDLEADPRSFLFSIEDFLGLKRFANEQRLFSASNVDAKKLSMPESVRALLTDRYLSEIRALEEWVPGISTRWQV